MDVVHRYHIWVGLLAAFLLWMLLWHLLVPQNLILMEEAYMLVPAQERNPLLKLNYEQILSCYICHSVPYMAKFIKIKNPYLMFRARKNFKQLENPYPTLCQSHHRRKTLSQSSLLEPSRLGRLAWTTSSSDILRGTCFEEPQSKEGHRALKDNDCHESVFSALS